MKENKPIELDAPMRALTWKQPFAELMLHKKIETRTWPTSYRGLVLICAGTISYSNRELTQMVSGEVWERHRDLFDNIARAGFLYCGKAIAIGTLVDCRPMLPQDAVNCFVDYKPGLWCHVYENVQQIEPVNWKGSQGWRNVPDEFKKLIKILAHAD